jgi:DNA-binding response OmpR family regulator
MRAGLSPRAVRSRLPHSRATEHGGSPRDRNRSVAKDDDDPCKNTSPPSTPGRPPPGWPAPRVAGIYRLRPASCGESRAGSTRDRKKPAVDCAYADTKTWGDLQASYGNDGTRTRDVRRDRQAIAPPLLFERQALIVLDLDNVAFPDASGFELCGRLRDGEPGRRWNRDVPVIMVSARGDPVDRVRGFARGCDDYVVKPFVYDELLARMRAVLRRANGRPHARLTVRDLEIDLASRVVRLGGELVQLSAKEYELLVALAEDPERVFKKEELLRNVWGFRSLGRTRTLDSHASRLRRKLNGSSETAFVLNVWGVGYRLIASSA